MRIIGGGDRCALRIDRDEPRGTDVGRPAEETKGLSEVTPRRVAQARSPCPPPTSDSPVTNRCHTYKPVPQLAPSSVDRVDARGRGRTYQLTYITQIIE